MGRDMLKCAFTKSAAQTSKTEAVNYLNERKREILQLIQARQEEKMAASIEFCKDIANFMKDMVIGYVEVRVIIDRSSRSIQGGYVYDNSGEVGIINIPNDSLLKADYELMKNIFSDAGFSMDVPTEFLYNAKKTQSNEASFAVSLTEEKEQK